MHRNYTPQKRANSQTTRPESESKFLACTTHYANSSTSNLFLCRACASERALKADALESGDGVPFGAISLFCSLIRGVIPNYHSAACIEAKKQSLSDSI
jgi:hypothetical protein